MSHNFIIANESGKARAIAIIKNLKLEKAQEFSLKTYRKNRSTEQHKTYWWWLKIFSDGTGDDPNSLHQRLKLEFLIPILERENEDYQIKMNAVNRHREKGQTKEAEFWENNIQQNASTRTLNTKQFAEYMEQVEAFAAQFGIALPEPDPTKRLQS